MQTNENTKVLEEYLKVYECILMESVKDIRTINNTKDTFLVEFDNPNEIMVLHVMPYDYGEHLIYKSLDRFREYARKFLNLDIVGYINWDLLEEDEFSALEMDGEYDGYVVVDTDDSSFLVKRLV